jgi:sugar/nucleoside kinase (ribokinase family)
VGDDNAGHAIRAGLRVERVDIRYVQAFEGARSSTSAIIVDDKGERLIVGQRDASMPSGTSWLPLERVKTADAVVGDVRWLEGVRAVFAQARKDAVLTLLDADLGAREAPSSRRRRCATSLPPAPMTSGWSTSSLSAPAMPAPRSGRKATSGASGQVADTCRPSGSA